MYDFTIMYEILDKPLGRILLYIERTDRACVSTARILNYASKVYKFINPWLPTIGFTLAGVTFACIGYEYFTGSRFFSNKIKEVYRKLMPAALKSDEDTKEKED